LIYECTDGDSIGLGLGQRAS